MPANVFMSVFKLFRNRIYVLSLLTHATTVYQRNKEQEEIQQMFNCHKNSGNSVTSAQVIELLPVPNKPNNLSQPKIDTLNI